MERGECFHVPTGLVPRDTNPAEEPHTGASAPWRGAVIVNADGL